MDVGVVKVLESLKKNNFDMTKLSKKERFYKDGIIGGTMDLTGGLISQTNIDKIYTPSSQIWKDALNSKINDVVQR